jgi:CRP-like cAMP-binding protein
VDGPGVDRAADAGGVEVGPWTYAQRELVGVLVLVDRGEDGVGEDGVGGPGDGQRGERGPVDGGLPVELLLYAPPSPVETLFILKAGRVRLFRVSAEGRALTTAILTPGTIFGEMILLGQRMYDNYAEALDEVIVCVVNRGCVQRYLLSDPRIAARIAEILGGRLLDMERRLSDTVFKSVPQRIAGVLVQLAAATPRRALGARGEQVTLTHEQIAALVGTSRETATKVLGEFADRGLLRLGRGRITLLDRDAVAAEAGD